MSIYSLNLLSVCTCVSFRADLSLWITIQGLWIIAFYLWIREWTACCTHWYAPNKHDNLLICWGWTIGFFCSGYGWWVWLNFFEDTGRIFRKAMDVKIGLFLPFIPFTIPFYPHGYIFKKTNVFDIFCRCNFVTKINQEWLLTFFRFHSPQNSNVPHGLSILCFGFYQSVSVFLCLGYEYYWPVSGHRDFPKYTPH